ncbi:MAG: hypothetical protein WB780_07450 [Candidatus Acidiferrales bacterium]
MMMLVIIMAVGMLSEKSGPTPGEQLLTCTGDLGMTMAKLNALESRAVVIYESNDAAVPSLSYHNLVEIRPGAAFESNRPLKPRWIVLPGEAPIDLWKSESVAWAAYNLKTRKLEAPKIVVGGR